MPKGARPAPQVAVKIAAPPPVNVLVPVNLLGPLSLSSSSSSVSLFPLRHPTASGYAARAEVFMAKGVEKDKKNNKPKLSTKEKQKKKKEKAATKK